VTYARASDWSFKGEGLNVLFGEGGLDVYFVSASLAGYALPLWILNGYAIFTVWTLNKL